MSRARPPEGAQHRSSQSEGTPVNNTNAWNRWGPQDERGALNLIGPDEVLRASRLVRSGEVLLHSMRTPAARRLGIDYETLASGHPGLVYCHATGYGD